MRSVIIAEIYCKALRRRDMSGKVAAAMPNPGAEADAGLAPPLLEDAAEGEKVDKVEVNITNLVGVDAFFMGELETDISHRGFADFKVFASAS
jgi:hypothetical protein